MAISISKKTVYILDLGDNSDAQYPYMGCRRNQFLRWDLPSLLAKPAWYVIGDKGTLDGIYHRSDELEGLFKESVGFLEQLELF